MSRGRVDLNYFNTHIIPCRYEYYEPRSLDEAIKLLDKLGSKAKVLAGGTDLIVSMKKREVEPKYIINLKRIPGLDMVTDYGDYLSIGALARLSVLEKNPIIREKFTALYEALKSMASPQVRNMATIGGNLCNASPAADTAPPLLVFNTKLRIVGSSGERVIPINEFFLGPKRTVLEYNELLKEIILPYPSGFYGSCFIKISRTSMDLAKASVAVKIVVDRVGVIEDVAIGLGAVAPKPIRAYSVEDYLRGRRFSEEAALEASKLVVNDISPITDIRSTAEYRRHVSIVITFDALVKAFKRARGVFG